MVWICSKLLVDISIITTVFVTYDVTLEKIFAATRSTLSPQLLDAFYAWPAVYAFHELINIAEGKEVISFK